MRLWGTFFLSVALLGSLRAGAAPLSSEVEELRRSEKEQESRLKALRKRVEELSRELREKSKLFHSMKNSSSVPSYIWQDEESTLEKTQRLEKLVQLTIRKDLHEVESLQVQEADLKAELEWIRMRLAEALEEAPKTRSEAVPSVSVETALGTKKEFTCDLVPFEANAIQSVSLIQDFGTRRDQETGIEWRSLGWWIGPLGRSVRACAEGKVVFSGKVPGRGRVVILDHAGGGMTLYANLNEDPELVFRKGDVVKSGALLGTPRDKLYFEARREGIAIHPQEVLPRQDLAQSGLLGAR